MQNAGQYVPGTANAHPPQQFIPSESSPNGGSTTSSLRQFRKREVDKSQLEQPQKQESHVARVAPHNHYSPVSNDLYRYQAHQFSDYNPQVKYSDIADASPPNPISTSVIQKPKPKDYMEMCNVQQQHLNNQQQYSPDNGQYMHRDPTQGYPTGYKPEAHYITKDQHQYQQLASHHTGQPKINPMMTQNMRKYNPGPADNPFLNKLSKIHPSMARSIISDHHLQESQPNYSPIDQRGMYGQQNHRYYTGSLHQPNPYSPNPNYSMNPPHHYSNYPSASCSYPRNATINPRFSHMERGMEASMSPTRRGYPENVHMGHLPYHNMPQKMPMHNYNPQYAAGPEYAQHYQHRRLGQECYPQSCRPAQYMPNHHQMPAQEMTEHTESRISPSDSLKKFIENWAADEDPTNEINPMDNNMNLRDNIKVRDDAPPGTVYMINATDVQYFENNEIPIVTSDNGGIQLTSENYQYLLKNGLVDNSGMVRIIEANKELSIDSSGNHERIVNLQIMETSKSDCMMVNKPLRPSDGSMGPNGMLPKADDERRVVIHQNTVISPGNPIVSERVSQQPQTQAPLQGAVVESISISKELVDKNCSPINLDQLEHNLGFSEPGPPETDSNKYQNSSIPISTEDSNVGDSGNAASCKPNEISLSEDLSQNSDDSQSKSPGSKSMPIIDLFSESQVEENETLDAGESQEDTNISTKNEKDETIIYQNKENPNEKIDPSVSEESSFKRNVEHFAKKDEAANRDLEKKLETEHHELEADSFDLAVSPKKTIISNDTLESTSSPNSVIVIPGIIKKDCVSTEKTKHSDSSDTNNQDKSLSIQQIINKKTTNINTSDPLINKCQEQSTSENYLVLNEGNQIEVVLENTGSENKTKALGEYKPSTEIVSVERRKRIFSVDDIMNHIGNNMKRDPKDFHIFCSTETLTTFIEKEMEFSSLEQTLNLYYLEKCSGLVVEESTPSLGDKNVPENVNFDESLENEKNVSAQQTSMLEDTKGCQETIMETKEELETDSCEKNITHMSSFKEPTSGKKENNKNDVQKVKIDLINDSIQTTSDPSTASVVFEPDERSNTPNILQYRNAIRIEETSVLLQIAGELMEINVNIVNGKKVITVVPLAETTVVDYNDNYEMSISGEDTEAIIQMDDSGIVSDPIENAENAKDNKNKEHIKHENDKQEENGALLKKETFIIDEEISNILNHEDEEKEHKDAFNNTEEYLDQVQSHLNENEFNGLPNKSTIKVTASHDDVSFQLPETVGYQETEFRLENETLIESTEQVKNFTTLDDVVGTEVVESQSEITPTKTLAIIETSINDHTSTQTSEVIEDNLIKECVAEDAFKSIDDSNIVEILETSKAPEMITDSGTIQLSETMDMAPVKEILETTDDVKKTEDLTASSHYLVNNFIDDNNITVPENTENNDNTTGHTAQNCSLETKVCDSQIKCYSQIQDKGCPSTEPEGVQFYRTESFDNNNEVVEDEDENDVGTENFNYPLEDDVFISAEPSHEIIISDPLEDVGLIEEVDKTSDSFKFPLEIVTASDKILESSEVLSTDKLENNKEEQVNNVTDKSSVKEIGNLESSYIGKEQEKITVLLSAKEKIVNTSSPDLVEKADKPKYNTSNIEAIPTVKMEKTKELIIKISKPEVQILSPTSTNIEDPVTPSKENVYLEPRRRFTMNDDSESTFVTVTTKAAKKLYECDLQIPAVTTSGDISTKISKKLMKCQHDTVSSSKKERIIKELPRSRKSILKRSKRINEKNKIKNEQKEMLRLLAEKRKARKEAKQQEVINQKEGLNKEIEDNVNTPNVENFLKLKQKHSTETDDEYVDFKELLRARKIKKLKKMQELKRREVKDNKIKSEDANKNVKIVNNSVATNKVAKVNKSNAVSSSHSQENKSSARKCFVGCNTSTKKSEKDNKHTSKDRKNSFDSKNNDKIIEVKNTYSYKTENSNSTLEAGNSKSNILSSLPVESKPTDVAVGERKADVDDNQSNINTDLSVEIKSSYPQTTKKIDLSIEETERTAELNLETVTENNHIPKKVKIQKRVSFCDDISSSTSHTETCGLSINEDTASLKIRTHSSLNPKDPRRRSNSKGYTGHVMVPSVSELIEENSGAVYKKKISLADYVSRKRKTSMDKSEKAEPEERECMDKKPKFEDCTREKDEFVVKTLPNSYKLNEDKNNSYISKEDNESSRKSEEDNRSSYRSEEGIRSSKKTIKDVKTSFVIHSSDWEDSQSPLPTIIQSNDECLIEDFSGLIKSKSKRPVIDVNELTPLETLENPKDMKLQEYKDKVDSQLSSLNIQIPKIKPQNLENKHHKLNLDPYGSPESSSLIKKFLSNAKITQSEMEKIKKIISYKRLIQHQKNARSPSKSPASSSSTYSQSPACTSYESTCLRGKSPVISESAYSASTSDPTYEVKDHVRPEADSREMRLHLKKVNAKRKLHVEYDDESSSSVYSNQSENRYKKSVDYSVINRLGKDGLPKIIFKRNRQSNISDDNNQLVVELERIDNNLKLVEEKYKVTVRR